MFFSPSSIYVIAWRPLCDGNPAIMLESEGKFGKVSVHYIQCIAIYKLNLGTLYIIIFAFEAIKKTLVHCRFASELLRN